MFAAWRLRALSQRRVFASATPLMNADSLMRKSDGPLRPRRRVGRAFRCLIARPCRPDWVGTRRRRSPRGQQRSLSRGDGTNHALGMCKRTRFHPAHAVSPSRQQHFEHYYAVVYARTLNRAASRRPEVWLLSVVIARQRPALNPNRSARSRDRTGRTCTCYLREAERGVSASPT